jgi:hypothetical protein
MSRSGEFCVSAHNGSTVNIRSACQDYTIIGVGKSSLPLPCLELRPTYELGSLTWGYLYLDSWASGPCVLEVDLVSTGSQGKESRLTASNLTDLRPIDHHEVGAEQTRGAAPGASHLQPAGRRCRRRYN